jgi:hypothetical protein
VGLIPNGVTGIFHLHLLSMYTMALGLTQPLKRMEYLGGKGSQCVELTTSPHSCADCHEILEPQPPGTRRAYPVL